MQKEQMVVGKAYRVTKDINDYRGLKKDSIVYVTHIGYQGAMLTNQLGYEKHSSHYKGGIWGFHLFFNAPWEWLEEIEEKKEPFITLELSKDQAETLMAVLASVAGHPNGYRGDIDGIFKKLEVKIEDWMHSPQLGQLMGQRVAFEDTK